jgi:flagellar assembly protein FliH
MLPGLANLLMEVMKINDVNKLYSKFHEQNGLDFVDSVLDTLGIKIEIDEKEIPGLHEALVADPSLSRGDFYLKGEHNELDGRIQTRFTTLFAKYIDKVNSVTSEKSPE